MSTPRRGRGRSRRAATVAAAGVMVSVAGVSCTPAAPPSAAPSVSHVSGSRAAAGARLWVSRYDGPAGSYASATAVAVSPDGSAVFVTGGSAEHNAPGHYATVGYDSATGRQLWARGYKGPGNSNDGPTAIAVSPDGRIVFVTGTSSAAASRAYADYTTIAYRASTGEQLWLRRYSGPFGYAVASGLVVSKDGKTVFVTGYGYRGFYSPVGYTTVAYNAATGAQRWVSWFKGRNEARDIAISPDGKTLYVTGRGFVASHWGYLTVAYNAATGAARWATRYHGPADGNDYADAVVVAPGGKSVYVAGGIRGRSAGADFATVAYNAATGAQRWAARGSALDEGTSLAVAPDGRTVIAAGRSFGPNSGPGLYVGYSMVAYDAATGTAAWTRGVLGWPVPTYSHTLAVSPDSSTVYVTGITAGKCCDNDYATVAYAVATGARQWLSTYNGPGNKSDQANALTLSPDGHTLYVTGSSYDLTDAGFDAGFATIAYKT